MPGERLGSAESPVIKLILAMEEFGKRFPGFEREVHGIEVDAEGNYWMRAVIETPRRHADRQRQASAAQLRASGQKEETHRTRPDHSGAGLTRGLGLCTH